ncbi:MAG TPA: FtsX-like permease family protein, partial [Acidimicrobiales bacterium]|nr:FtsX-like permease family protein [Acidimicrobiales bacterium]
VAVIVALAAGAGMAAFAGARRADSALERLGTATGEPNVVLVPLAEATGRGHIDVAQAADSVDLVDEAMAIPGVEAVTHAAYWAISPDPAEECLFGFGIVSSTTSHPLGVPVAGRRSGAANEVVINETTAGQFGLRVGSELRLRTVRADRTGDWLDDGGGCAPADGPEIPLRVTAIIRGVENVTDTAELGVAVGPGFYDRYAGEVAGCACTIWVRADSDRLEEVRPALQALYGPYGFTMQPDEQINTRATETIALEVDALRIAALVALIAGALVVVQVISRQAAAIAADHEVRRALGMTRPQMAAGTALAVVPAIVTGGLVAVVGAALASSFLPRGLARRAEPDPGIRVDAAVLVGGFAVTVLLGLAAAWTVGWMFALRARQGVRRSVRGAIGPLPPHVAFGVRMAINPAGDRWRGAAWSGVVGVALAVTGALAVWTVVASANHLRHTPELFGVSADLVVDTEVDDPQVADVAVAAALADSGIEAVASVLRPSAPDTYDGSGPSGASASVEPRAFRHERGLIGPTIQEGRFAASADEVVLGRATAAALAAELGDRVTVTRIDRHAVDYVVVGIAVSYGIDVVDQGFEVTESGLQRLAVPCRTAATAPDDDESGCAQVEVETVLARTAPGADRATAAARLGDVEMTPLPTPSIVDRFREIGPVPWYLAAMLATLGAVGLMHSSLVTGRRRARELAVTRALGFTPGQAAAAVRWQGLATATAGLVLGLAGGVLVGHLAWRNLADNVAVVVAVRLPPWAPLLV